MSKNPIGSNNSKLNDHDLTQEDSEQQKEGEVIKVNEEEAEEEEYFYESDSDPITRSNNAHHQFPIPKFPKLLSQFDIWISEPTSVSERRTRLLREMVNETREDGMWNKLKEVGTGKQLTMEEFKVCVRHSSIVQELMRRQNIEEGNKDNGDSIANGVGIGVSKSKKKGSWLKSIKSVANSVKGHKERRSEERDTSLEKGGRRSSSATDGSQYVSFHGLERVRVKQYGKPCK